LLQDIGSAMGFHFMCVDGVEADDVIATLSLCAKEHKLDTIIASGDKDLMQLVNEHVHQLDMKGNLVVFTFSVKNCNEFCFRILAL
jgi:DNA polymerase-1